MSTQFSPTSRQAKGGNNKSRDYTCQFILFFIVMLALLFTILGISLQVNELDSGASSKNFLYENSPVISELKAFDDVLSKIKSGKPLLILFYAHWCGHCRKFVRTYSSLALAHRNRNVGFIAVNCAATNNICPRAQINLYPTVLAFNFPGIDFPDLEQGNNLKAVGFKPTHRSIKQWEDTLSTFPVIIKAAPGVKHTEARVDGFSLSLSSWVQAKTSQLARNCTPEDRLHDAIVSLHYILHQEGITLVEKKLMDGQKVKSRGWNSMVVLTPEFDLKVDDYSKEELVRLQEKYWALDRTLKTFLILLPSLEHWEGLKLTVLPAVIALVNKKAEAIDILQGTVKPLLKDMPNFNDPKYVDSISQSWTVKTAGSSTIAPLSFSQWKVCGRSENNLRESNAVLEPFENAYPGFTCGLWFLLHYLTVAGNEHHKVASTLKHRNKTLYPLYLNATETNYKILLNGGKQPNPKANYMHFPNWALFAASVIEINAEEVQEAIYHAGRNLIGCDECRGHFLENYEDCSLGGCQCEKFDFNCVELWLFRFHDRVTARVYQEQIREIGSELTNTNNNPPKKPDVVVQGSDISDYSQVAWPPASQCRTCRGSSSKNSNINTITSSAGAGEWKDEAMLIYLRAAYWDTKWEKDYRLHGKYFDSSSNNNNNDDYYSRNHTDRRQLRQLLVKEVQLNDEIKPNQHHHQHQHQHQNQLQRLRGEANPNNQGTNAVIESSHPRNSLRNKKEDRLVADLPIEVAVDQQKLAVSFPVVAVAGNSTTLLKNNDHPVLERMKQFVVTHAAQYRNSTQLVSGLLSYLNDTSAAASASWKSMTPLTRDSVQQYLLVALNNLLNNNTAVLSILSKSRNNIAGAGTEARKPLSIAKLFGGIAMGVLLLVIAAGAIIGAREVLLQWLGSSNRPNARRNSHFEHNN